MIDFTNSNKLYEQLSVDSGIKLYRINGLDIPFNPNWIRIGINLSGGADSACLLMILCDIIVKEKFENREIHVINFNRCWNIKPWQGPIGLDVYNKFVNDYPSIKFFRHQTYIAPEIEYGVTGPCITDKLGRARSGDQITVGSYNKYVVYTQKLDAVFNATSANPAGTDWPGAMPERSKTADRGDLSDLVIPHHNHDLCHPFRFVDKAWITAQFYKYNKLDLYNMTRSCEGDITHRNIAAVVGNLENYNPSLHTVDAIPLCGDCWWCKERTWAESKLEETLRLLDE